MNEDARTKSAFSTVEASRSVFELDYHQLTKIAQNVEAFDACGKITHGIFIGARAHMKKHSALERLSCLQSVFLRLSNARCFNNDPLDTLALKGLSSATHAQPLLE